MSLLSFHFFLHKIGKKSDTGLEISPTDLGYMLGADKVV